VKLTDKNNKMCGDSRQKKIEFTVLAQMHEFCESHDGREKFTVYSRPHNEETLSNVDLRQLTDQQAYRGSINLNYLNKLWCWQQFVVQNVPKYIWTLRFVTRPPCCKCVIAQLTGAFSVVHALVAVSRPGYSGRPRTTSAPSLGTSTGLQPNWIPVQRAADR